MADIGIINVKVQVPEEALDLLRAIKDAVAAIEAQPFCACGCRGGSVTVTNNFEAPRG